MNFIVVGDIHIKASEISDISDILSRIEDVTLEKNPKFVVLLGDIFNNHEKLTIPEYLLFHHFLMNLLKIEKLRIYILIGNHDRPKNTCYLTDEHFLNGYKCIERVTIVDKVTRGEGCLFVPYVQKGRFHEAVKGFDRIEFAVFTHQEFSGLRMQSLTTKGDDAPEYYPKIINGHIHDYQLKGNIINVGAVRQVAFNEDPDKAILYFPGKDLSIFERIPVTISKKITLTATSDELSSLKLHDVVSKENKYKIVVTGTPMAIDVPENVSVVWKPREETLSKGKTYMQILRSLLMEEKIVSEFEELFGKFPQGEGKKVRIVMTTPPV